MRIQKQKSCLLSATWVVLGSFSGGVWEQVCWFSIGFCTISWKSTFWILRSLSKLFKVSGKLFRSSLGAPWGLSAAPSELIICRQAPWIVTSELFGSLFELSWQLLAVLWPSSLALNSFELLFSSLESLFEANLSSRIAFGAWKSMSSYAFTMHREHIGVWS